MFRCDVGLERFGGQIGCDVAGFRQVFGGKAGALEALAEFLLKRDP